MAVLSLSRGAWARIAPFAAFMALLALRAAAQADGARGVDPQRVGTKAVVL
jgi:hypothetical protein